MYWGKRYCELEPEQKASLYRMWRKERCSPEDARKIFRASYIAAGGDPALIPGMMAALTPEPKRLLTEHPTRAQVEITDDDIPF